MPRPAKRTKPATELRKTPKQARSEASFEAIVEAAARILAEGGPRALTTNRIARRAGVSVGSLYQYFPNKLSIVRALLERELARAESLRPPQLDDPAASVAQRMRAAVDWQLDVHAANPALSRALHLLVEEALPAPQRAELLALRGARTQRAIADSLAPGRDLAHAAFVVETCLDALIDAAVRRRPRWIATESFRSEVAHLLTRYLATC
jgi:AcrR family transcriptional regulator